MILRTIIGIFLIVMNLWSCQNSNKEAIEKLKQELIQKEQEGNIESLRNQMLERQYADAVTNVLTFDAPLYDLHKNELGIMTQKMRKIDLTYCPKDFQLAYLDHIHAWEDMARIQTAYKKLRAQDDIALIAGIVATLTEAKASPFSNYLEAEAELDRLGREAEREITDTWQVLERLTIQYGGKLPK